MTPEHNTKQFPLKLGRCGNNNVFRKAPVGWCCSSSNSVLSVHFKNSFLQAVLLIRISLTL